MWQVLCNKASIHLLSSVTSTLEISSSRKNGRKNNQQKISFHFQQMKASEYNSVGTALGATSGLGSCISSTNRHDHDGH